MKIWILILLITLLSTGFVNGYIQIQYSTDNTTWTDEVNTTASDHVVNNLGERLQYYFRARNVSVGVGESGWSYAEQKTIGGDDMTLLAVGGIFIFLTFLVVGGIILARSMWLRICLSVLLSLMIVTLLRLSVWFITIRLPSETGLINSLEHFYGMTVTVLPWIYVFAIIYLIYYLINSLRFKKLKKKDDWGEWEE